jgi:hypothetical protein
LKTGLRGLIHLNAVNTFDLGNERVQQSLTLAQVLFHLHEGLNVLPITVELPSLDKENQRSVLNSLNLKCCESLSWTKLLRYLKKKSSDTLERVFEFDVSGGPHGAADREKFALH